jgi:hypothetical protein
MHGNRRHPRLDDCTRLLSIIDKSAPGQEEIYLAIFSLSVSLDPPKKFVLFLSVTPPLSRLSRPLARALRFLPNPPLLISPPSIVDGRLPHGISNFVAALVLNTHAARVQSVVRWLPVNPCGRRRLEVPPTFSFAPIRTYRVAPLYFPRFVGSYYQVIVVCDARSPPFLADCW